MRAFLRRAILPARVFRGLLWRRRSFLHRSGWIRSQIEGRPVHADGRVVPWMNYPITRLLAERIPRATRVLETGSGWSSVFFGELAGSVITLETDPKWAERMRAVVPPNVEIIPTKASSWMQFHDRVSRLGKPFDLVVLDGPFRPELLRFAPTLLSPRGVILLDDSDRRHYQEALQEVQARGFRCLRIHGMPLRGTSLTETAILYRSENTLNI